MIDATVAASAEPFALAPIDNLNGLPLERVIDVPLAVRIRFGRKEMTLQEVLALSTGSLVELDQMVEDPVDLLLGDRVIARGEVVIVDGNYGLRVMEVIEKPIAAITTVERTRSDRAADAAGEDGSVEL